MARNNRGRQKIEMKKISKESNLLVTFSKRRSGLFKKAFEFCMLCGVQIAIIVFSPAKKVFSFGQPDVETIVDKAVSSDDSNMPELVEAYVNVHAQKFSAQLIDSENQLEAQEHIKKEFTNVSERKEQKDWRDAPEEELGVEELQTLKSELEELKKSIISLTKSITERATNYTTLSEEGGEIGDGSASGGKIIMTPEGYALVY